MKITIIPKDKTIIMDGVALEVECDYPNDVQAIHWFNESGRIEYCYGSKEVYFTDISNINCYIEAYNKALQEIEDKKTDAEILIQKARDALTVTDLVAVRCLKVNIIYPQEWIDYTEELRLVVRGTSNELPVQPNYPEGT